MLRTSRCLHQGLPASQRSFHAGAAESAWFSSINRRLADVFSLNIPGIVNVDIAAPPLPPWSDKDKHDKFAKAPGPFNVVSRSSSVRIKF